MESSNKLDSTEKQHKAKWEQKKGNSKLNISWNGKEADKIVNRSTVWIESV